MPRDFHKLIAWQKADDLVLEIYRATGRFFPAEERYGLTQQLRRSAVSVPSNLAEGCGRRTEEEFRQFLFLARGSLHELEYQLHLAARLGYLPEPEHRRLQAVRDEAGRLLIGLIHRVDLQIRSRKRDGRTTRPGPEA